VHAPLEICKDSTACFAPLSSSKGVTSCGAGQWVDVGAEADCGKHCAKVVLHFMLLDNVLEIVHLMIVQVLRLEAALEHCLQRSLVT
jgi:hypothetical protein